MFANAELIKHDAIGNKTEAFTYTYNHENSSRRQ